MVLVSHCVYGSDHGLDPARRQDVILEPSYLVISSMAWKFDGRSQERDHGGISEHDRKSEEGRAR